MFVVFFSCKLPLIRNSYFTACVSFMAPSGLLGTFSRSFSTFNIYITIIATADVCCHFRIIIILLTFPVWEIIEKYTQALGGNKHQLYC